MSGRNLRTRIDLLTPFEEKANKENVRVKCRSLDTQYDVNSTVPDSPERNLVAPVDHNGEQWETKIVHMIMDLMCVYLP